MKIAAQTDIGNCRSENQDNYSAQLLKDGSLWAVVCDGMGGASGGKLAAQLATEEAEQFFTEHFATEQPGQEQALLLRGLTQMNDRVLEASKADPALEGMGTTAVCLMMRDGTAHLAHIGDSRAYLCRGGVLHQVTRDHSMVQAMVESGKLTPEQARVHPKRNIITRALGIGPRPESDYTSYPLQVGDIYLLCSDGLTNMVSDAEILKTLQETPFYQAPARLIERALAAGGTDNITVLLAAAEPTEEQHG